MSFWTRLAGRASLEGRVDVPTSEALARRLREGDATALEPLYRGESAAVYRYALALCGQPDWAADATQEAFVRFAGKPEGWDAGRGTLGAYLAGVARHHLLARWRDMPQPDDDQPADEDRVASPEQQLVQAQDQSRLRGALQALPWTFREAVVLVDLQERSYVEAARIAGIEVNTLRTRLHRGRARLLVALRDPAASTDDRDVSAGAAGPVRDRADASTAAADASSAVPATAVPAVPAAPGLSASARRSA